MDTILIVEDDEQVRNFLKLTLISNFQVMQATDAAQAIELAGITWPDLVLLDLNLTGHRDGLDVCRALRRDPDPALGEVPILMLTAATTEPDIRAALAAGATGYVSKPYNPFCLLELITTLLTRKTRMLLV